MTWRHVIKSLLFKPDSQLCVIFTQFTPAFTPRRVELRIVVLFLSLFSRGEAKDQLSVSVVVVCRCPGVDKLRGLSSVLNSSVRSRDQAAVTCTDEDGPWRYVRLDCYHGNSHIFTLCLLCVCRWQQPWWRFWSLLVWRLMGSKPWSCPQHLRVSSMGPDPEWRSWPGPDLRPIQDWEAPEVGLVERCLQGLPKECTMTVNSTLTHTHTHVWCIVGCLLLGYRRCCVHGLFHSRNVL